jgi:hypothetical protein
MNAETYMAMANDCDEFIYQFCKKYNVSPLSMSGVMLARLTRFAIELDYMDSYDGLLNGIIERKFNEEQNTGVVH